MRHALVIALALLLAAPALAQMRVRVEPNSASLYRGQTLTLQYVITGADEPPPPPEIEVDGLEIEYAGLSQSSSVQIINNRRFATQSFTLSYAVTPKRTGSFSIPPVVFEAPGGDTARSRAVPVVAAEAPESEDFQIALSADETRVYVGQPVRVTWNWRIGRNVAGAELDWPAPENADVVVSRASDPNLQRRPTTATLMDRSVALSRGQRRVGGVVADVYSAELILIPQRPGELVVPAASALIQVEVGRRGRGISMFDRETTMVSTSSDPLTITVLPLPEDGRPSGFTGLVGDFALEASAEPTSVRVGDPIELNVILRGPEPLPERYRLDLEGRPEFARAFRVDAESESPDGSARAALFRRTLRATRDDVTAIPPIEVPYFDPELGRYAVARSAPIAIEVAPTRVVTLADAQGAAGEPMATGETIESRAGGLAANVTSPAALADESLDLRALAAAPLTITLLAAPPALLALAAVAALARTRREAHGPAARRRRALPDALARLRDAKTPDDVAAAIPGYLRQRWPDADPPVAVENLAEHVESSTADAAEQLAELERRCDAARFGGAAASPSELADEAERLLLEIDAGKESR